jgi:hypothetical protein
MAVTENSGQRAFWRHDGQHVEVMGVCDPSRSEAPGLDGMPAHFDTDSGILSFHRYPSLQRARELLPEYGPLWDSIGSEVSAEATKRAADGPVAVQHSAFFSMPY